MRFDIFLSSNSRSGYTQDIVDLFAKPIGAKHTFRYAEKWIADDVKAQITQESYKEKRPAILCYVDQITKNVPPLVMPVRFASIADVRRHGSTVSIVFELEEFCRFGDLQTFNKDFREAVNDVPNYINNSIDGKYWLLNDGMLLNSTERSNDLTDWERLIESYYCTPNARSDIPFYRFEGIFDTATRKAVTPVKESGELVFGLSGGRDYEIRLYHYHPKEDFPEYAVKIAAGGDSLTMVNGDTRVLNTRYDQKDYRLTTDRIVLSENTSLAFQRVEKASQKLISEDFVLRTRIEGSFGLGLFYILFIALGFAAPFVIGTFTDPNTKWPVILAALAGGLAVGLATLFKEKIRI